MPEYANPVDPPDLGLLPTLRRLLRLWWDQRRMGAAGLSFAFVYTLISTTIPILMQRAIDNAVVEHTQPLWPYLLVILALGSVRFVVNFLRRYATARIGIRIEARMRELLYEAYLRYPRAFYDRHATGQVLSRATNDLYPIRYFIGWGLVQGTQSVMMIIAAGIVLVLVDPQLTLYAAVSLPPIGFVANRFGHRVSPISRRGQAREGDVTQAAHEGVVGVERGQGLRPGRDPRARVGGRAAGARLGRPQLRLARRDRAAARADEPSPLAAGTARPPLRARELCVRWRGRRAARPRPGREAWRDRRRLRVDGLRQDVAAQSPPSLLRPDRRASARRRRRYPRPPDRGAARGRRARYPNAPALSRAAARGPPPRPRGRRPAPR